MAKSKAERMEEYRARKKEQLGEAWMKRERERVKGYYKPNEMVTDEQKSKRRALNRRHFKKFYDKRKRENTDETSATESVEDTRSNTEEPRPGISIMGNSDDVVSSTVNEVETLTVKMPFNTVTPSNKRGAKKRQSRALKRSYKRIETLEDQNETLKRKLKSAQKRLQRWEAAKQQMEATTPKSKTDALLRRAGLKKTKDVPDMRKQFLFAECVHEEVRTAVLKDKACVQRIVSGKVVKKYRMRSHLQRMTENDNG